MLSGPYERFYPGEDKGLLDPTWGGGAYRLSAPSISEHGGTIGLLTVGAGLGLGGYRLGKLGYQGLTKAGEAMDRVIPTIKESVPLWLDLVMSNLSGSSQRERLEESAKKLGADPNMVLERSSNVVDFPGGLLEDFGPDSPYWEWRERENPDEIWDMMNIYQQIADDFGPFRGDSDAEVEKDLDRIRRWDGYTETEDDRIGDRKRFNAYRAIVQEDQEEQGITDRQEQIDKAYLDYRRKMDEIDQYWVNEVVYHPEGDQGLAHEWWGNDLGASLDVWREMTFGKPDHDVRKVYMVLKNKRPREYNITEGF